MINIAVVSNLIECNLMKTVLESHCIECFIKNEMSSNLAGELPFNMVMPELWITHDEHFEEALTVLEDFSN